MIEARRIRGWARFPAALLVGALSASPALALPPDLPVAVTDDTRLYLLIASGVLLFAALVGRMMRRRKDAEPATEEPRGYGMRFFRADRPIALE